MRHTYVCQYFFPRLNLFGCFLGMTAKMRAKTVASVHFSQLISRSNSRQICRIFALLWYDSAAFICVISQLNFINCRNFRDKY